MNLGGLVGDRHLLGRPDTGVATADSCHTHSKYGGTATDTVNDCALFVSPAPVIGFEWRSSGRLSINIALRYSFARLRSETGLVSWLNLMQFQVGPRLTF